MTTNRLNRMAKKLRQHLELAKRSGMIENYHVEVVGGQLHSDVKYHPPVGWFSWDTPLPFSMPPQALRQ